MSSDVQKTTQTHGLGLGEFTLRLKQAGICDLGVVQVPGANVLLPWGVALSERLVTLIRASFNEMGLDEYAYPQVVPEVCFEPMADLLDSQRGLLQIATRLDMEQGRSRGVLTPTGEQVIASHWRQLVHQSESLPIRMFQRARYFRPVSSADRSGKGVFAALEAADIFEFHCCHPLKQTALDDIQKLHQRLLKLVNELPLPQFVGIRPPWGNHSELYEWALGGDTPLPSGECVQTSALYFQGQQLSRRYDIGFGKGEQRQHTWQLDGFVSRRTMYAQLCLTAKQDGSLSVHPRLASTQIVILARSLEQAHDERQQLQLLLGQLKAQGRRVLLEYCVDAKALTNKFKQWKGRGAPLLMLYFGRRHPQDQLRIRLYRTDSDQEVGASADTDMLARQVENALDDIDDDASETILRRARAQIVFASSIDDARDALAARKSVVAPVCPTRENAQEVATWKMGELCSFAAAENSAPCIFSGRPTWARALLSRRI
ncbi:hypothetical protein HA052_09640 [Chromobacterium haemolyticum]|uniref:Proline--tRNA ligase n=1 Tax=Chromobacterium fluminis TaxID=3044269 RepID=A0ABX0L169_9NEIS|nr:hypothetical protein [Chromobacterium haemolyticum]NHR05464.1 hypothetical protein [Chromobacterium haemolyticum]